MKRLFVLIMLIMLVNGCGQKDSPVVATINGDRVEITRQKLDKLFAKKHSKEEAKNATLEDKEAYLDHILREWVQILKAYDLKYDQDSTVVQATSGAQEKFITNAMYQKMVIDKIVNEKEMRQYYENMDREIVPRNIFFKCAEDAPDETVKEVKTRAEEALKRIRKGEPFPRIAREVSEDEKTQIKGGLMHALKWRASSGLFLQTLFSLEESEVSDVFRTEKGFHIVKADEIKPLERETYEKMKPGIREELRRGKQQEISDYARAFLDDIIKRRKLVYHEENIEKMAAQMKPVEGKYSDEVLAFIETLPDSSKEMVLATYDEGELRVKDMTGWTKQIPSSARLEFTEPWGIKYGIEKFYAGPFLEEEGRRLKIHEDEQVKVQISKNLENTMVKRMLRVEVYEKIEATDEDVKAFYEANKEARYFRPARVKIQEVMVKDRILAENIKRRIEAGENMGRLAAEYTIRPGFKKKQGISNYFPKSLWGEVGKTAHTLKKGELAGPIEQENGKGYSVIRVLERREQKTEPLSRMWNQVKKDCFFEKRKQAKVDFIDSIMPEYDIVKYTDRIEGEDS